MQKSTRDQIRARFDADVERFSDLSTGQVAQQDALLHLDLLTAVAAAVTPRPRAVLDLGCGAGNYVLKLFETLGPEATASIESVTLVDLAPNMLERAMERISAVFAGDVVCVEADIRAFDFGASRFDVAMAAQCLHHLRVEAEWDAVFSSVLHALCPGGGFWICDSLVAAAPAVERLEVERWGRYLGGIGGVSYREKVLAYVEKEDTPRDLFWQLKLLEKVGFETVDVLHKHGRFASFGAVKEGTLR